MYVPWFKWVVVCCLPSSPTISLWEKLIGCMSVMFSWRFVGSLFSRRFGCFENGIICYIYFSFICTFHYIRDIGMSQKLYDECIMMISNYFINCISFFVKWHAWMIWRECVCLCVDIYVFNFALTSCSCWRKSKMIDHFTFPIRNLNCLQI